MKFMILVGITIGSIIGGAIGSKFDGGLGAISILLSTVGGIVGLIFGYKAGKYFTE
jgi:hypothetical protein